MIVCVCKVVSDRHIRNAVADGATCMRDITRELKVGTCCGKCIPHAKLALHACLAQENEILAPAYFLGASSEVAV